MINNLITLRFIAFLALITLVPGCKCNKDCDDPSDPMCKNYDPCFSKSDNTADFWIYEDNMSIYWANSWNDGQFEENRIYWPYYDADTVWSDVTLVAKDSTCDKYIWEVGAGVYHGRTLSLNSYPTETEIEVKLTTVKSVDTHCFPDGKDTISKIRTFYKKQWDTSAYDPIEGVWFGFNTDSPNKKFSFSIEKAPDLSIIPYPFDIDNYVIKRFPEPEIEVKYPSVPDTIGYTFENYAYSYRQTYFHMDASTFGQNMNPYGYFKVYGRNNDSIYVSYYCLSDTSLETFREKNSPDMWRYREFYGKRIK